MTATAVTLTNLNLKTVSTLLPTALANLGILARHQGKRVESDSCFRQALWVWDQAYRVRYRTPFGLLENKAVTTLPGTGTLQEGLAQKLPGDVIEREKYDLLLAAPEPPDGVAEILSMLGL